MSAAPEHLIRPGLTLHWGEPPVLAAGTAAALFCFSATAAAGTMQLRREPPPPAGFGVIVALSAAALAELLAEDKTPGAERVRAFLAEPASAAPPPALPLAAGARLAVESVRRCPFVGACRAMALAARAHDLLLEFLTALSAAEAPHDPPLTRAVAARLHAAAETLKLRLDEPPALAALARAVGLGESSLKRGFRQVYGTTVFGYLRARRMERARALLLAGEATVLEAATLVGYSNPSNFAAAFRREFGVNPKQFQLAARR